MRMEELARDHERKLPAEVADKAERNGASGQDCGKPLTEPERGRLVELESVIARGLGSFVEVGRALQEIRDRRLYREQHATFEGYCRERFRMTRQHANRTIRAAVVAGILEPIGSITN